MGSSYQNVSIYIRNGLYRAGYIERYSKNREVSGNVIRGLGI